MNEDLAQKLMDDFADSTGLTGATKPRRYLWTDAFAVCNFLGLHRRTRNDRYLAYAVELVNQAHQILGRHRPDDSRSGWIGGLSEEEGASHPTAGGLRIGKELNERQIGEAFDADREWSRDGQYFHYLTKWMHALNCLWRQSGNRRYLQWAGELATAAHHAFVVGGSSGERRRMTWKMSIDLKRPLISSMGQHDPLDGFVTYLELQSSLKKSDLDINLMDAINDFGEITHDVRFATDDALGIGGLLDDASRLTLIKSDLDGIQRALLIRILIDANKSLKSFNHSLLLNRPAETRLAFRELGLAIGLGELELCRPRVATDPELATRFDTLLNYRSIGTQVQQFWSSQPHRLTRSWLDHREINTVMLATAISPEGYWCE